MNTNHKTALELKQHLPILTLIDDEIKCQLRSIHSKIEDASKINNVEIIVNLPTHFYHLHNKMMSNDELRKRIYYKIIISLEQLGYTVNINISEKSVKLRISWRIQTDQSEINKMNEKLNSIKF